jgi:hypothetical protein
MSQRIADASAKVARSFYALPRMTDNVLSASLGQLTGLSGAVVKHSNDVKSFSFLLGPSTRRFHARSGTSWTDLPWPGSACCFREGPCPSPLSSPSSPSDAARYTASVRVLTASFRKIRLTCVFTVSGDISRVQAMCLLEKPWLIMARTSHSRAVSVSPTRLLDCAERPPA